MVDPKMDPSYWFIALSIKGVRLLLLPLKMEAQTYSSISNRDGDTAYPLYNV